MRCLTPYLSLLMLFVFVTTALACPMCKDSITESATDSYGNSGAQAGLPSGFNFSIYWMLIGVFCMMGFVIGIIAKGIRSADATSGKRGFEPIPKSPPSPRA